MLLRERDSGNQRQYCNTEKSAAPLHPLASFIDVIEFGNAVSVSRMYEIQKAPERNSTVCVVRHHQVDILLAVSSMTTTQRKARRPGLVSADASKEEMRVWKKMNQAAGSPKKGTAEWDDLRRRMRSMRRNAQRRRSACHSQTRNK
jgi:hypothetical protein